MYIMYIYMLYIIYIYMFMYVFIYIYIHIYNHIYTNYKMAICCWLRYQEISFEVTQPARWSPAWSPGRPLWVRQPRPFPRSDP